MPSKNNPMTLTLTFKLCFIIKKTIIKLKILIDYYEKSIK